MGKVSIVIPSYSEHSRPYLDLCIKSIKQLNYDMSLIDVLISSPQGYIPLYEGVSVLNHPNPNRQFAEAINFGVRESNQESEFVLLLNDDTIMTPDSLRNMVALCKLEPAVMGPISNCDQAWKYLLSMVIEKDGERFQIAKRFFHMEEFKGFEDALMNAKSEYPSGALLTDTLALYATLIPRTVWAEVGELDETFKTGYEDSDWCHRAKLKGYPLKVALNALVWHFGGVATKICLTDEQTAENKRKFEEKWCL